MSSPRRSSVVSEDAGACQGVVAPNDGAWIKPSRTVGSYRSEAERPLG